VQGVRFTKPQAIAVAQLLNLIDEGEGQTRH
jgi:hypothetical protein